MIFEVLWTVDRCSFKAFGVILLYFKLEKMNWGGVIFTGKKKFEWGTTTLENL
jgi:hypothetical protein